LQQQHTGNMGKSLPDCPKTTGEFGAFTQYIV
jgi:hypothetical protein